MENKGKFYITTAIAYASRKPHFGNTYEVIMTDAIARFKRQVGYDVYFCTGTDEHGQKIENCALEAGIEPKEYVDRVAAEIKGIWDLMGASYDKFIRTTDENHETAVKNIFKKLYEQGDIYKGSYEGWYCTPCESFFTETQIVDGKCPDCGAPVHQATEEAYFFRMSKYADRLMAYIDEHPEFIEPESRKKEMVNNFLKAGLQDLCVSRSSFKWGVPVDFDDKHVIYVWIDALSNYITALGYDPANEKQPQLFEKYWPADVHIIGKDILRFHTIYWPIMLMALDVPLPKKVFGHPWFNFGQDKMSKSKGNVIYADELAEKFTVDGVRHFALSEMPYSSDGSITYENVITRYNNDLANNLGNLVSRTLAMNAKYFDSVIPAPNEETELDRELKEEIADTIRDAYGMMESYHIADASDRIFSMLRRTNKYIDETMPWALAKNEEDRPRLATVIYNLLEAIRIGAVLLTPFIPSSAQTILDSLSTSARDYDSIAKFGALEAGNTTAISGTMFARIDEKKMFEQLEAEMQARMAQAKAAQKPEDCEEEIKIDDFMKVELRCAKVLSAEKLKKAKKLLKLQVDLGYEKRQVLSGIAKDYEPEDIIGKKVALVANLAPATLCGELSEGMILATGSDKIRVVFLDDETPLGDRIR